jgi:hypothetical protein
VNDEHPTNADVGNETPPSTAPEVLRQGALWSPQVISEVQEKAELGRYRLRGFGTLRQRPLPSLDDLTFIP